MNSTVMKFSTHLVEIGHFKMAFWDAGFKNIFASERV
jgi:hypothetical protein